MDSFVYTISFDMIGPDKTKTNWCDRERIGTILFLAISLLEGVLYCEGDGRTDLKILRDIIDSFFLYYCTTNLIFDRHVISILAPRYVLHVNVWALRKKKIIKFDMDPFRWDVIVTSVEVATDETTC